MKNLIFCSILLLAIFISDVKTHDNSFLSLDPEEEKIITQDEYELTSLIKSNKVTNIETKPFNAETEVDKLEQNSQTNSIEEINQTFNFDIEADKIDKLEPIVDALIFTFRFPFSTGMGFEPIVKSLTVKLVIAAFGQDATCILTNPPG